jgi:hypothetical protein
MDAKATMQGTFDTMKTGVKKVTDAISNTENQEKVRAGASKVLAGFVGLINAVTYTATAAVVAAKNGVVDGVSDTDKTRRS